MPAQRLEAKSGKSFLPVNFLVCQIGRPYVPEFGASNIADALKVRAYAGVRNLTQGYLSKAVSPQSRRGQAVGSGDARLLDPPVRCFLAMVTSHQEMAKIIADDKAKHAHRISSSFKTKKRKKKHFLFFFGSHLSFLPLSDGAFRVPF